MAVGFSTEAFFTFVVLLIPYFWRDLYRLLCVNAKRRSLVGDKKDSHGDESGANGFPASPENGCDKQRTQDYDSSLEKSIQTFGTDSLTTEEEDDDENTQRRRTSDGDFCDYQARVETPRLAHKENKHHPRIQSANEPFYDKVSNEFSSSHDDTNVSMDFDELLLDHKEPSEETSSHQISSSNHLLEHPQRFFSRSDSHLTVSSDHSSSALHFSSVANQLRHKLCRAKPTSLLETSSLPRLSHSSSRLNYSANRLDSKKSPKPRNNKSPKPSILDARRTNLKEQLQLRGIKLSSSPTLQRDRSRLRRRLSNFQET